jgi:hypothetical protein
MCQLTKNIQKIVTKLSEILVVDPVSKIRKKTVPYFGPGVKKAADPGSRSAALLGIIPDIDGILGNVVRHLLVFIHVARGNRQHRPIVREGQAETVATDNEHNLRRAVMKTNVKALVPQLTLNIYVLLSTHDGIFLGFKSLEPEPYYPYFYILTRPPNFRRTSL